MSSRRYHPVLRGPRNVGSVPNCPSQAHCRAAGPAAALGQDRSLLPAFVEEGLRFKSPTKVNFRLARVSTQVGGVDIPPEAHLSFSLARPTGTDAVSNARRSSIRTALTLGSMWRSGAADTVPGGPLVRSESRITTNRILDRLDDIRISESHHGPPDARRFQSTPSYIMQGVEALHLEFAPL